MIDAFVFCRRQKTKESAMTLRHAASFPWNLFASLMLKLCLVYIIPHADQRATNGKIKTNTALQNWTSHTCLWNKCFAATIMPSLICADCQESTQHTLHTTSPYLFRKKKSCCRPLHWRYLMVLMTGRFPKMWVPPNHPSLTRRCSTWQRLTAWRRNTQMPWRAPSPTFLMTRESSGDMAKII